MRSSSTFEPAGVQVSPVALILAFVAGVLAVPVFHQILFLLLHLAGIIPVPPFNMTPTRPLGVPAVVSSSFWGGVWGVVFALTVRRRFRGPAFWVASAVIGGVVLTLVYMFVVLPLKTGGVPSNLVGLFSIGFLLNAAWGIGWALFLTLFERWRGSRPVAL